MSLGQVEQTFFHVSPYFWNTYLMIFHKKFHWYFPHHQYIAKNAKKLQNFPYNLKPNFQSVLHNSSVQLQLVIVGSTYHFPKSPDHDVLQVFFTLRWSRTIVQVGNKNKTKIRELKKHRWHFFKQWQSCEPTSWHSKTGEYFGEKPEVLVGADDEFYARLLWLHM